VIAEAIGTAMLLAAVVGSGIMGERLAGGNLAIALLANTLATGAALVALILTFGPISGAHLNPGVTLADASQGGIAWRDVPLYVVAQLAGGSRGWRLRTSCSRRPSSSPRGTLGQAWRRRSASSWRRSGCWP
jgi:glycerol uptake facilitator-like aquaporin